MKNYHSMLKIYQSKYSRKKYNNLLKTINIMENVMLLQNELK